MNERVEMLEKTIRQHHTYIKQQYELSDAKAAVATALLMVRHMGGMAQQAGAYDNPFSACFALLKKMLDEYLPTHKREDIDTAKPPAWFK